MQNLILDAFLIIGGAIAGSFMGLLFYSKYKQSQILDKIRFLVTADVTQISKAMNNIQCETLYEKTRQERTIKDLENFLARNIIRIHKITDGTVTSLHGKYFHLPVEEMFKLELLYSDLSKFNKTMESWGKEIDKHKIDEKVVSRRDVLFEELTKECEKINASISRFSDLSWYKKWENKLHNDLKFKDDT